MIVIDNEAIKVRHIIFEVSLSASRNYVACVSRSNKPLFQRITKETDDAADAMSSTVRDDESELDDDGKQHAHYFL